MSEDDNNGSGLGEKLGWKRYAHNLAILAWSGPETLEKINNRLSLMEDQLVTMKVRSAENSTGIKALFAFLSVPKVDTGTSDSSGN